jgi:hypothetical protein
LQPKHVLPELKLRPPKKPTFAANCEAASIPRRLRHG